MGEFSSKHLDVEQVCADVAFSGVGDNENNCFSGILSAGLKGGMEVCARGDTAEDPVALGQLSGRGHGII